MPYEPFSETYMISTKGRVKSLDRYGFKKIKNEVTSFKLQGQLITPIKTEWYGYDTVNLTCFDPETEKRHRKLIYIHKAMGLAFLPNPGMRKSVTHLNRDKKDNRIENLMWK